MTTVAAFDFDGTLSTRDCVVPFLVQLAGRRTIGRALLRQPATSSGALVRRDRDRLKEVAVRAAFAGREALTVERVGATFAEKVHRSGLRADTTRRLQWHQTQGHRVVIVSASLGTYLRPLSSMLGVDAVLCTEALIGADGRYTGDLIGRNCRGVEKLRRLHAWLAEMEIDHTELWAYGDSAGDRELLAAAQRPLLVKNITVTAEPGDSP